MKQVFCALLAVLLLTGCTVPEQVPQSTEAKPWVMPASPYEPADFQQDGDFLSCSTGGVAVGIDVSAHQKEIDWKKVADSGVEYVFVRLGYRGYEQGTLNADSYAAQNLKGAKAEGLLVGAYFFSQAVSIEEARAEAYFALGILDGMKLDLPLVYDWEYVNDSARTASVDRKTLTDCTLTFCQTVEQAGYRAMIYFNSSQGRDMLELEKLEIYPWWLAKYDLEADFLCRVDLWQYTNTGKVPGIQGNVDIDLMFTDHGLGKAVFGEMG